MTNFKRFLLGTPIAAGLTVGLGLIMVGLIASDDLGLDTRKALKIDAVNPVEIDIDPPSRIEKPKLRRVEIPPAPPKFERTPSGIPAADLVLSDLIPPIIPFKPDSLTGVTTIKVQDVQPVLRIAPAMPPRAERSGHCRLTFNVSAEGSPYDVSATQCSQDIFARPSVKSVLKWRYLPQYKDGAPVPYIGLSETIRFRLEDERGNIIPE